MIQAFLNKNYEIVDFSEKADIYIINTCTVTSMADKKSRQIIRRTKVLNPNAIVVAVGCYAQVAKDKLEEIKDIDLILGINEKPKIVEYVENKMNSKDREEHIADVMHQKKFVDFGDVNYTNKNRVAIKVQDGCNQFCTYCIIPFARGRIRSRKIKSVIKEVKELANRGIKEIVITGIHVASYGKDFEENIGLIDLLEEINKIEGIERIRLSSLEPTLINEEFVKRLSKLNKVCDHFHLSLQSGCNETLKRMNRHYSVEDFKNATELLRNTYPKVALTTDIIVGFPGETDEEFKKTYDFLKNIEFYKMHVFKYSPRNGTKAEKMPNQIDGKIKEERSKKLIELSNENEMKQNRNYYNKKVKVLIEELDNGYYKGHTTNYILVKIKENGENLQNKIVDAKIIDNDGIELIGKLEK